MEYLVSDIIKAAKVALDENVSSKALADLQDVDTLKLDEIILSKVEDAARLVVTEAPRELLDSGTPLGVAVIERDGLPDGVCRVAVPDDYLRLLVLQTSDWRTPAIEAITEDDPRYLLQSSPCAGIRGNADRPIVALVHTADGSQALELHTTGIDSTVKRGVYVPRPTIDESDRITLPVKLYRATVYRVAALTALAVLSADQATALMGISRQLSGINNEPVQ